MFLKGGLYTTTDLLFLFKDHVLKMFGDAQFSECGKYRYWLSREWTFGENSIAFIMLNPSTADSIKNDSTVTRCIRYAQQFGYQKLIVLNIFAYRSTDPKELYRICDPVGSKNEEHFTNN